MAQDEKTIFQQKVWLAISNFLKEPSSKDPNQPVNYWYSEKLDVRTDPYAVTLLPATVKESGSVVTDLLKFADTTPQDLVTYSVGSTGNFYSRNATGLWTLLHQTASSHGNGISYFDGDKYVYYASDKTLGRYGPLNNSSVFTETWRSGIDLTIWNNWGGAQVTINSSSLLQITSTTAASYYGIERINQDLTSNYITNQLVSVGSRSLTSWEVYPLYANLNQANQLFWYIDNANVLKAYKKVASVNTILATGTYDSTVHKYFKIRESAGTTYFDYSTDTVAWTNFASVANPFAVTSLLFGQFAGTYNTEASTTSATFTNFTQGSIQAAAQFSDDFLASQGGIPQNTYSLALVSASSQSADAADSASLSQTGDITLEAKFKHTSLPAVGSSMTLIGKWDESGVLRSYIMDIYGVSGVFGDGSNGALTVSADATDAPIDSAATGSSGSYLLAATNASFAVGQRILIHQTQGTNAGQRETNIVSGYSAGTITLQTPLGGTYTAGAQVMVLKQYTNVTINSGKTLTAKAWNGTVGGIIGFLANGTLSVVGTITATGKGFRGATGTGYQVSPSNQGEGTVGVSAASRSANGNGGGGGGAPDGEGAGGSHATAGTQDDANPSTMGSSGSIVGSSDLTTIVFGGGGGAGEINSAPGVVSNSGGTGGGIVFIYGSTMTITGAVTSSGQDGTGRSVSPGSDGSSGAGAGGSILLRAQTATLGAALIVASGGAKYSGARAGAGGSGRIHLDYLTSYSGTTTPTLNVTQDNTLVTSTTYQARIGISNDGTANEYLTKNLPTLTTGTWNRLSITWKASNSTAEFFLNALSLGTTVGSKTAIHDNASLLYIGANKGASAIGNYLNGFIDDVRIWGQVQTAAQIFAYNDHQLTGNEGGLKAYYKLNNAATDATTNANNLTLRNAPSYSTDVPFVDPTTRLDIDQSYTTTGSTYALAVAISEATADQLPFTPTNDPQKSIDLNVSAKGTGNWTVTIHDTQNNVIASKTITNAQMASGGYQEFVFATPWRIIIGRSYHVHITSTVADGVIVTSTLNSLQSGGLATGDFHTYYQFLVTDTLFHPMARMLNFIVIGNERYIAKWDGAFYTPNLIAFPSGTHVRCVGYWGKYIVFGTWQETASGTPNIYDFSMGKIYFWDGISLTFNFSIEVPEGQVNALFGMDADLYYFAGFKGDLMKHTGTFTNESGSFNGLKVKRNPYLERNKYVEVYPQSMAMWRGILHFGMGANTDSTTLPQGVYSWGTLRPEYAESLSFDYVISTGNKGSSVKIGLVYPVGRKLLISWSDGLAYGCDVIDSGGSTYYTSGLIQTSIQDGSMIYKDNNLLKVRADHVALATGEGIEVGYKLNREANFEVTNSLTDSVTKRFTTNTLTNGRAGEVQYQVKLSGNGTSTPTFLAVAALTDALESEQQF